MSPIVVGCIVKKMCPKMVINFRWLLLKQCVIVDRARPLYQADHYRWYKKSHGWRRGHAPTAPLIYHAYYYFYYHYYYQVPLHLKCNIHSSKVTLTTTTSTKTTPQLLQRTSWVSQYNLSHLLERVARWQFIYQAQAGSLKGTGGRLCSNI